MPMPPRRRRVFMLACIGLVVSLTSSLSAASGTGATAAPASVTTTTAASVTTTTSASVKASPAAFLKASPAALSAASPPDPAHPFSDPIWSPLRAPSRVSCVLSNCPGPYHGFWAIDFIDKDYSTFETLYAAGAGIFHIGAIMGRDTCSPTGVASSGTWVWIDHGGSRTTLYTHLYSVLAKEGQLVTPATAIGKMGHNGNRAPCKANYLHMEYREHGKTGPRLEPRSMLACTARGRVSMPSSLGYASWNAVPTNQNPKTGSKPNIYTPAATNGCMAASRGAATPARPVPSGRRGPASATISWGAVSAGVGHTFVTIDRWIPSQNKWGNPVYRVVTGRASSTTFTGLANGRPYRLRAASHNGAGYSAWTAYVTVTPGQVPNAPRAPRTLSTTRDAIRYSWWLPVSNGRAITRFVVARRCLVGGAWTAWTKTNVAAHAGSAWNLHYNWTGMPHGRTCSVMVEAVNSVGAGSWSAPSRATTKL